jgi:hypothetical protein
MRFSGSREMIQPLETRRMLAGGNQTYFGTSAADMIIVFTDAASTHVVVNGVDHETTAQNVRVLTLGGNDLVRLGRLDAIPDGTSIIFLELSDGNDLVTNLQPGTLIGTLNDTRVRVNVDGEAGNDVVSIDDSDGTRVDTYTLFGSDGFETDFSFSGGGAQTFMTLGGVETFELNQNSHGSSTTLRDKLPAMRVSVTGGSGPDRFTAGGGDIDGNGWTAGTTTLIGGAGNDLITFDSDEATTVQVMTVAAQTLNTDGGGGFIYSAFDEQVIDLPDGPNTVTVNGPASAIGVTTVEARGATVNLIANSTTTHIFAGLGVINVGAATLAPVAGPVIAGARTVNLFDHGTATNQLYQFTVGRLVQPIDVQFGSATLTLNAGGGNDTVIVDGTAHNVEMSINGNFGDDVVRAGHATFGVLAGPITFAGGAGTDRIEFDAAAEAGAFTATLTAATFTASPGAHVHRWGVDVEGVHALLGSGGSDVRVNATAAATTVTGGSGSDHVVVGNGDYSTNIRGDLVFNGGGGDDSIVYDDAASTANDAYSFSGGNQFLKAAPAGATITNSVEHKTLRAGSGNNTITIAAGSQAIRINANAGNDTVNVGDSASPVTVDTGPEDPAVAPFGDTLVVNSDAGAGDLPVTAVIDQDDVVRTLNVLPGGTLRIAPDAVLRKVSGGQFGLLGTIDLAGGALLGGPTQAALRTFLVRGYNGGAWNGTHAQGAIHSSLAASTADRDAVGYGLGSEIAITSIGSFAIAPTDLLARHTLSGDANLDAAVTLQDFNRLAGNFGQTNRAWVHGDSTYDGAANLLDFNQLAGNFGLTPGAAPDGRPSPRQLRDELLDRATLIDYVA